MAEAQWYFTRNGQQVGPVSGEQLRQMIAAGQVAPTELVWREGMANWQPLHGVAELSAPGPGPAAPLPPIMPPGQPYGMQQGPYPGQGPTFGPLPYGPGPSPQGRPTSYRGMAIAGFVCAILGLFCGVLFALIGIVLGALAWSGMNKTRNNEGKGMAVAAVVIGIIGFVGGLFFMAHMLRHPGSNPFLHMRRL